MSKNKTNTGLKDTNASPSAYGWSFQVGAGISLMLDNITKFSSMKMEGASDDIEITTPAGKIYAQAKSVTKIGDQSSAAKNLQNSLRTLSQVAKNGDALELIYITNIENPLSSKHKSAFTYGNSYEFSILPDDAQKKILKHVGDDFPATSFRVHIIRFFGEGDNKFASVKEKISEFLREALDDKSYTPRLLDSWFTTFMVNASDKPDKEKSLELDKKEIILPIVILAVDTPLNEQEFSKVCDYDNYEEIQQRFRTIVYDKTCDYNFYSGVLGDYITKRGSSDRYDYVMNEWASYGQQFEMIKDEQLREALIKYLLLTIITQKTKIEGIRKAANL